MMTDRLYELPWDRLKGLCKQVYSRWLLRKTIKFHGGDLSLSFLEALSVDTRSRRIR